MNPECPSCGGVTFSYYSNERVEICFNRFTIVTKYNFLLCVECSKVTNLQPEKPINVEFIGYS